MYKFSLVTGLMLLGRQFFGAALEFGRFGVRLGLEFGPIRCFYTNLVSLGYGCLGFCENRMTLGLKSRARKSKRWEDGAERLWPLDEVGIWMWI